MPYLSQLLAYGLATLCLAYPWVHPFHLGPSVTVVSGLVAWWGAVGLGLCFCTLLSAREARWRVLLAGWGLAAGVSALMGLFQYFDRAQLLGPWVNYAGLGQAFGNLRQRNQFATLCSMGLVLRWWGAQYARAGALTGAPALSGPDARSHGAAAGATATCVGDVPRPSPPASGTAGAAFDGYPKLSLPPPLLLLIGTSPAPLYGAPTSGA